jgi:AcrR family transcriptional regulator
MPAQTPTNTDPRAIRSRKALHRALLSLLNKKPIEQITIRDITAKAGVGYATFFRHHPTKESLLEELAAEQISALINLSVPVFDSSDLRSACLALFTYVSEHRTVWKTLLTGGADGVIRKEFLRLAKLVGTPRAPDDAWLPADFGVILIVSGTLELLTWWLNQAQPLPVEKIAEIHERIVVSPTIEAGNPPKRPPTAKKR